MTAQQKPIAQNWSGHGKYTLAFGFEPGALNIKLAGHDTSDGNGEFVFADECLEWDEDQETGKQYRWVAVPNSELLAIRDKLNEIFPPAGTASIDRELLRQQIAADPDFETEALKSQGEARKWLGDVVAAMVAARYQPGDHPIVPTKIAAFIDKAEEMLPRVLSALSGLSLPGRDAETRVTPEQNEALHKALLASGTPVAPPISGDDAVDRDTVIAAIHATLPNLDAQAVGRVADNVMPLFALSTVQDGSVREALDQALTFSCMALAFIGRDQGTDRINDTLNGLCTEAAKVEKSARAALSALPQSPAPISGDASLPEKGA